ncbi:MAG: hypothetical protein L0Z48_09130 [candidate division Zixibacteria bacterium]|nr:hypothetical protein [candidate division Zixibacteria bacterium]
MMAREELIHLLQTALEFEEKAAPIVYEKSMACLKEMSNLEILDEDKRKIKRLLYAIMSDANGHCHKLESLLRLVKEGGKDEF